VSLVLAFDTATEQVALAIGVREGGRIEPLAHGDFLAPRQALSGLLPAVERLLAENGRLIGDVREIVVGRGPGSFTGVRIGVATAKGLAHGLGVPVHGVSTLDAIAWRSVEFDGVVGVVGDAMRKEVYPALFRVERGQVVRLTQETVARPESVAEQWAALDSPLHVVGNGLAKYAEMFDRPDVGITIGDCGLWPPTGSGLLAAYAAQIEAGAVDDGSAGALLPVYTRLSDAEENERARVGVPGGSVPSSGVDGPVGGERS